MSASFSATAGGVAIIASILCCVASGFAQQPSYLVTAPDSSVSLFDLASNSLIEKIDQGSGEHALVVGPNSRLAFVGSSSFISVIDLTIGREIKRIYNVAPDSVGNSMAFTRDGRYLLVADKFNLGLAIIDPVALSVVREVPLAAALGTGVNDMSTVVVIGTKAYVTSDYPDQINPAMAVVDLNTFTARAVAIPYGIFDFEGLGVLPNAAVTSDGRYLVLAQENGASHLLYFSTVTDRLVIDREVAFDPAGIVINPALGPSHQYGYFLGQDFNGNISVTAIDLRPGSQSYGDLLLSTESTLPYISSPSALGVSPDGTRVVVGQFKARVEEPPPNVFAFDTAKLLTDPSHAIVGQVTVPGNALGATIASVTTQPSPTAPSVTGVSGSFSNDIAHTIHVFGTNFASGAQVRVGSMVPLPATVNSPTDLQITVPVNAPAAPNQDVVVTNPNTNGSPNQQNQSGLLAGGLSIFANPLFQPANQLAGFNYADGSLSLYDINQRAMTRITLDPPATGNLTFNGAGSNVYAASNSFRSTRNMTELLSVRASTDTVTPITFSGTRFRRFQDVAASRNPATGRAVVYSWVPAFDSADLQVNMTDADPSSPTFNTVIGTFFAELPAGGLSIAGTATPDGRYVYVNYLDFDTFNYMIPVLDIVHGGPATILMPATLNAVDQQYDMVVSPDGSSLLLNSRLVSGISVLDISQNPLRPTLVTTIRPVSFSSFFYSYEVVGNRLFVLDVGSSAAMVYNFDRQHMNFSRLGRYAFQGEYAGNPYLAVSPDGSLIYLPLSGDDEISVLDANKLVNGQPPLITNLASFRSPNVIAVSPASH